MTQEFYAVPNVEEEDLTTITLRAGFIKDRTFNRGYISEDAFIQIQRIDEETHVANNSGYQWGFVLDLSKPKREYDENHPASKLLTMCKNARAYSLLPISKRSV